MERYAEAIWKGPLLGGNGTLTTQSGAFNLQPYNYKGRFEDQSGRATTNPEELIAAAHAGCYAMQLAHILAEQGTPATQLQTKATVSLEKVADGYSVKTSHIELQASVPNITQHRFDDMAERAKQTCPISKVLRGADISLDAKLLNH